MNSRYAPRDADDPARAIRHVQETDEGNRFCADCGTPNPDFMNLTLGTFVCSSCADVHRSTTNRRVKDIFSREVTSDDVRRMREVGNEVANRKFLARWNPNEFPAPNPSDKEQLREFIWLKYEGSWKRAPIATSHSALPPRDAGPAMLRHTDYTTRGGPQQQPYDTAGMSGYGRERAIFRDAPRPPEPARSSYWANKYVPPQPQQAPPNPRRFGEDEYYRLPMQHPDYRRPPSRMRYDDSVDEEYQPIDIDPRRSSRRYSAPESEAIQHSKRSKNASKKGRETYVDNSATTDENTSDEDIRKSKKVSKKKSTSSSRKAAVSPKASSKSTSKPKSKSKHSKYVDSDSESEEPEAKAVHRTKKKPGASDKKSRHSRKNTDPGSDSEEESDSSDKASNEVSSEESSSAPRGKRDNRRGATGKSDRRKKKSDSRDTENPFASDSDDGERRKGATPKNSAKRSEHGSSEHAAKMEFDLMSDWMGTETDATTNVSAGAQSNFSGGQASVPMMQQPHNMPPPIMPPMSVYPGMIFPGAGVMLGPGMSAGMHGGMPIMHPMGMGGLIPGMTPMMGAPTGGMSPALPNGFVHGMQNLSMQTGPAPPPPNQSLEYQNLPKPPAGPPPS